MLQNNISELHMNINGQDWQNGIHGAVHLFTTQK